MSIVILPGQLIYAYKISKGTHQNNFGLGEGGRHRSNVWTYAGANTFRPGRMKDLAAHPTVKPKKLLRDAILDVSKPGDIVLEVFAGSGSTLVAAAQTGRHGAGIGLDPVYVDHIIRELEIETGLTAVLDSGETFAEIHALRATE